MAVFCTEGKCGIFGGIAILWKTAILLEMRVLQVVQPLPRGTGCGNVHRQV
jgi:hypothetical protein